MCLHDLDANVHVWLTLVDVSLAHFLQKKVCPCCNWIVPGYSEIDRCQYCLRKTTEDCHKTAKREQGENMAREPMMKKHPKGIPREAKWKPSVQKTGRRLPSWWAKLKNDSRYTKAKTELSKFCRDLWKTNLRVPCVKTAESLKCVTLLGVLVFWRKMSILTLRWTQDKKAQLQGCAPMCLIPGWGGGGR